MYRITRSRCTIHTLTSTLRTHPALSAMYMLVSEKGSGIAHNIFDCKTMGLPCLFPDFAALRARVDSDASVWKKCPGSVDRDIVEVCEIVYAF